MIAVASATHAADQKTQNVPVSQPMTPAQPGGVSQGFICTLMSSYGSEWLPMCC